MEKISRTIYEAIHLINDICPNKLLQIKIFGQNIQYSNKNMLIKMLKDNNDISVIWIKFDNKEINILFNTKEILLYNLDLDLLIFTFPWDFRIINCNINFLKLSKNLLVERSKINYISNNGRIYEKKSLFKLGNHKGKLRTTLWCSKFKKLIF